MTEEREMAKWVVDVYGYSEETFEADSRGKARYKAYKLFRDAGYNWDFHKFLINSIVFQRSYEASK